VELVLAPPRAIQRYKEEGDKEPEWRAIVDAAAFFISAMVSSLAREEEDNAVRVGVPWGLAVHELIERIQSVKDDLNALDSAAAKKLEGFYSASCDELERIGAWPPRLTTPLAAEDFLRHQNVHCIPVVGVMGAYNARTEANSNAVLLSEIFGGKADTFGDYSFYQRGTSSKIPQEIEALWQNLHLLILTGEEPKELLGSKVHAGIPKDLWNAVQNSVGECAGLYLGGTGQPWDTGDFERRGIPLLAIHAVAERRGSILVIGAQERRIPVALAMLRGHLVSTLITNLEFAWEILRKSTETC